MGFKMHISKGTFPRTTRVIRHIFKDHQRHYSGFLSHLFKDLRSHISGFFKKSFLGPPEPYSCIFKNIFMSYSSKYQRRHYREFLNTCAQCFEESYSWIFRTSFQGPPETMDFKVILSRTWAVVIMDFEDIFQEMPVPLSSIFKTFFHGQSEP